MVVVIGGTHHNTLSIIRCLGEKNVDIVLILCDANAKNNYVLKSKYIKKSHVVDDAKQAIKCYENNYKEIPVIVCSDDVAALMNNRYEFYMNKQRQVEIAKNIGFNVPYSLDYKIGRGHLEKVKFPCLVKPLSSYIGGKKVDVCYGDSQLKEVFMRYSIDEVVQIQQLINKEYEIVIIGLSVNGQVIIPGYVMKHRDINGGTSFSTTYSSESLPNELKRNIFKLVNTIKYEGLFGVEFIYNEGKYFFIEINLRNDATTYALSVAGVNLPYIYILAKQGKTYSGEIKHPVRTINAIVEKSDLVFVFNGELSIVRWWKDFKRSECKYFYNKKDKGPFYYMIRGYMTAPIRRIKRMVKLIIKNE